MKYTPSQPFDIVDTLVEFKLFLRKLNLGIFFHAQKGNSLPKNLLKKRSSFTPPTHKTLISFENVVTKQFYALCKQKNNPSSQGSCDRSLGDILDTLSANNIRIMSADKGGGIVLYDQNAYIAMIFDILHNPTQYEVSSLNQINIAHHRIDLYLEEFLLDERIDEDLYKFLKVDFPQLATIFGIPKVHKDVLNPPFRPIIAGSHSKTFQFGRVVDCWLKHILEGTQHIIRDSWEFLGIFTNDLWSSDMTFVTIDIKDLFSCIPKNEGLHRFTASLRKHSGLSWGKIQLTAEFTEIVLNNNFIYFEGEYYRQISGVAMGAACAPIYANLVLLDWEEEFVLNSEWMEHISCYVRYLDDLFLLWKGDTMLLSKYIEYINQTTTYLEFVHQYNRSGINYLDVFIYNDGVSFQSKMYRKDTFSNGYLDFSSSHPYSQKRSIIKGQCIRAARMTTVRTDMELEIDHIGRMFRDKGYPLKLIKDVTSYVIQEWGKKYMPLLGKGSVTLGTSNKSQDNNCTNEYSKSYIVKYGKHIGDIQKIVTTNWNIITSDESIKNFVSDRPTFVYKTGPNIKNLIEWKANRQAWNTNQQRDVQEVRNADGQEVGNADVQEVVKKEVLQEKLGDRKGKPLERSTGWLTKKIRKGVAVAKTRALEVPQRFEDVAVEFSREEWKMLSEQEKELHRNVMVENYENMISVGYDIPVEHLLLYIKDDTCLSVDTEGGTVVQQKHLPCIRICINRNAELSAIKGERSSLDKCIDSECHRVLPEAVSVTGKALLQTESRYCNSVDFKDEFLKTAELEMHLDTQEGETPCRLNENSSLILRLTYNGKRQNNALEAHEQISTAKKLCSCVTDDKGFIGKVKLTTGNRGEKHLNCSSSDKNFTQKSEREKYQLFSTEILQKYATSGKGFARKHLTGRKSVHNGQKPYKCAICGKNFIDKRGMILHQVLHTEQKPFKCATCGKGFTQKGAMLRHQFVHTGQKPFKCATCGKGFAKKDVMLIHQFIHTGQRPFKCTVCNKSFIWKSAVVIHQNIHTGQKPYKCDICGMSFTQKGALSRHEYIHTGKKPYKCATCGKGFSKKEVMETHQYIHTGQRPFKCNLCDKSFRWKSAVVFHKSVHTGQKPYKCTMCDKSFTFKCNLTSHQKIHTGEKPYKCTMCDRSFRHKNTLVKHQSIHSGQKLYKCSVCDKRFRLKRYVINHEKVHSGQKPYTCATCDKGFTQKGAMVKHQNIHTGQKSYKCTMCDKSFAQKGSLVRHQNTHAEQKPYKCTMCDKSFSQKSNMIGHQCIHNGQTLKWTVDDKKEIMHCFFYAKSLEFPQRGYIARIRKKLEERKMLPPEKLSKVTYKSLRSLVEQVRTKQILDKDTLDHLEKYANEEVLQEKEQKAKVNKIHKEKIWTQERKRDLIWCSIYAEKKALLMNMDTVTSIIFNSVYRQRNPDMAGLPKKRITTQRWKEMRSKQFSNVVRQQIENEVIDQLRNEGFNVESLTQMVSRHPQKIMQQTEIENFTKEVTQSNISEASSGGLVEHPVRSTEQEKDQEREGNVHALSQEINDLKRKTHLL
ncbi:uncharacterized protein LOC122797847 [Protopterus annectens]|uniref:uncharacterized protein LOC122797847 n=1 Tax=Protopterus annectens TaxID=7888 RepID=UPI001CF9EF66|nr:uncharacterized protein LOC122797847 [Protopterus annectens]